MAINITPVLAAHTAALVDLVVVAVMPVVLVARFVLFGLVLLASRVRSHQLIQEICDGTLHSYKKWDAF
jgi:hypothetical protein